MAGVMMEESRLGMLSPWHGSERPHKLARGVTVLFERKASSDGQQMLQTAILTGSTSVHEIKLTGRHRGWFKDGDKLILGGRELLEHETVGNLQKDNDVGHLHVYVKLSDISRITMTTSDGQQSSFESPRSPKRSALTAALSTPRCSSRALSKSNSFLLRGQVVDDLSLLPAQFESRSDDVLHLIIRRPKVNYSIKKDSFDLTITATDDIQTIKDKIEAQQGLPAASHALLLNGQRLLASKSLESYGIQPGAVLELAPVEPSTPTKMPSGSPVLSSKAHELYEGWLKAKAGLAAGLRPKLAHAGTGGSYFIQDKTGESVAVFKPQDEEPLARNNPKGHSSDGTEGFRKGIQPGEGAVREVAAFLLDHGHFAGVPPTALVSCRETSLLASRHVAANDAKIGSLQAFVKSEGDCEERGTSLFSVEEVHKIAILDMRLGNCDRNGGNILIRKVPGKTRPEYQLIPIDHGYCLPSTFSDLSFEWAYWPQARQPFSAKSRLYIADLNVEKESELLRAHGLQLRRECERVRKVCTMLLKMAAAKGLTPAAIANIMSRESLHKSPLEKAHSTVLPICTNTSGEVNENDYLERMSEALSEIIDDSCVA